MTFARAFSSTLPSLTLLAAAAAYAQANPTAVASPVSATSSTATANGSEAQINALYERWTKAFEARDVDGIMACYAPGDATLAYDVVAPLQYRGKDAYRKDYEQFLALFDGPIKVEYRDVRLLASGNLGVFSSLERLTGKTKDGQKTDLWIRVTSVSRKIHGQWLIVHDHVSVPADFATGKALLTLTP